MKLTTMRFVCLLGCVFWVSLARAEDWPTYRHDNRRSGVTPAALQLPLVPAWQRKAAVPPQPAWSAPAPWDAYSGNNGLQAQRDFDLVYYTTSAGELVYFGSSVDNAVHCLEASSGKEQWGFFTGAAVRLPPTLHRGKAYFGSDDGYAYCVDASDGTLVWKLRGGPADTLIPSNGKLVSPWPCRTGVLIDGDNAYCAFSLVPWKDSFLCSLNAEDGRVTYRKSSGVNTFQGPMAADGQLVVMQGKAPPLAFEPETGNSVTAYGPASGVRCALLGGGRMAVGPKGQKNRDNLVLVVDRKTRAVLAGFPGADRLLVDGPMGYLHRKGQLVALDLDQHIEMRARQKKSTEITQWELLSEAPCELIKAGRLLFVGTKGKITAVDAATGQVTWKTDVEGSVHGLTAAAGRLFASTDLGHIYAFVPGK